VSDGPVLTKTGAFDLETLFLGKLLGKGVSRKVYLCRQDTEHVLKVEDVQGWFQNVLEWEIWNEVKHTKWAKYFAPCISISDNGQILIQQRTRPIEKSLKLRLPDFFSDLKLDNIGLLDGKPVVHDYGISTFLGSALRRARLKLVNLT
jgi:hypothetical protein